MAKKRFLVIDGMYFANRVLGGMTSQNETLSLEPEQEQSNFLANLHNSFWTLVKSFNNESRTLINNVIFVSDYGSWRKKLEPYTPGYYRIADDGTQPKSIPVLGYKENRVEKKEKSTVNYDIFYKLVSRFNEEISGTVPVVKVPNLEGDDCICLLSAMFAQSTNAELIVFCTDGDLEQCVNDNVMLFRNIKSKQNPNGEFVISQAKFHKLFIEGNDPMTKIFGDNLERDYYHTLFSMQLSSDYTVQRVAGKDIRFACPHSVALKKIVCGDAKDNVFPILRKVGELRNRSVSEKELNDTIEMMYGKLNEKTALKIITDKETRDELFVTLRGNFKFVPNYKLSFMEEHFERNKKLIWLTPKVIGEELVRSFVDAFKSVKDVLNKQIEIPEQNKTMQDNATELYANSIPGVL